MRGAAALLGAIGAISALAPAAGFAADLPAPAKTPAAATAPSAAPECSAYGSGFFKLGGSGFCGKANADIMGFVAKDFATSDIALIGQRLPSSAYAAGVPILYYYNKDFSSRTNAPYPGIDAQTSFVAMRQTDYGALIGYVNLRVAGQLQNSGDSSGGMTWVANNAVNGSVAQGLVDQAWVRLGGLEVGIQPSMFGFARWGYSITPGYSSLVNTPAISYTYRDDNIAGSSNSVSASIALEDPSRREMADGVLANYAGGAAYRPDVVAQVRFGSPTVLLHIGGVLHEIQDAAAWDCCYSSEHKALGGAATAGGEFRVKWSNVFGPAAGDTYGRLLLQFAAARGAMGYLGIPFFATDYVANGDGDIHLTEGYSMVTSYEHLWTPTLKSSITYSLFSTSEASSMELLAPDEPMWFDVKIHGALLQGGIEDMLQPGLTVGGEAGYTWTTATGMYAGAEAAPLSVRFPNLAAYVRKVF
jgi:hypothetical protein